MDNIQEIKAYAATLSLVHTKNELERLIHEVLFVTLLASN